MRKVGQTHSWALAVTSLVAVVLGACGTHGGPDGSSLDGPIFVFDATADFSEAHSTCQDNDHDQFGVDCRLGPDCDDSNPAITDQCYRCASPATGCSCTAAQEGERLPCDAITDSTLAGPDGTCHLGARTCTNGTWSRCIALDGSNRTLTGPLPCPGVCDPRCQDYPGCPNTSGDLGSSSSNVMIGDAGAPVWCPMSPGGVVLQPTPGTVRVDGTYCSTIVCGTNTSCCGSCYTYSNRDRQAPALCGHSSGSSISTGESVCGQTCATGTTHCGVAPFDYCCNSTTQDCRFGVCVTRGSGACNSDSDCPSGQYCNQNLGNSSSYCTPVTPALCSCSGDTTRQGCLSNVVAQGGTIIEDIFRTSDGHDARSLHFARYLRGLANNPTGTCPVGRTNAAPNTDPYPCPSCSPDSCTGNHSTCFNAPRDATTISSFANTLDWRWIQEQRTTSANVAVADGDSTNYSPQRSVIYDLGAPSNRTLVFPIIDPMAAGASVGACSGPLAFTVWMTNNPNATTINTSNTTIDPTKWNQARLIAVYTEGWTRNAAATGDASDTTDLTTTAGGAATADGMTTEWQVACGQNFRYVAITAGFQGGGGSMNACSQDRVRNIIDAVAGLDENGRVPGIIHVLPYGTTAGPDTVTGYPLPNADVYFLVDTSSSMAGNLANIQGAIETTGEYFPGCDNGIMNGVRCVMPDSWFGAGQVQDFPVSPYGASGSDTFYIHNRDVTSDMTLVTASLNAFAANGADTGGSDALEAQVPALWSVATGRGIQAVVITGDGGFMGTTYNYLSDRAACATGSVGYPCFRAGTLPVVVAFTDQALYHNGPGNTNMYDDYALFGSGAVTYPATATAYSGSDDWSATTTPSLSGSPSQTISGTTSGFANDNTSGVCGGSGRDLVYQFTLTSTSRVHYDTNGTSGSTPVIYIRSAAGVPQGCSAATSTTYANLDLDLPAGTYQLWMDATSSSTSGPFQFHFSVNAPPAATLPNWATTVAALNSIGARVITVDSAGTITTNDNTSMANATNAISSGGIAYRFGTDSTMSNLASVTVGADTVVQAILAQASASSRMDVYAVAVDNPATASVNESRFVQNPPMTTATTANLPLSATPYATGICTGTTGSPAYQANSCLSGNAVNFSVTWVNNIVPMTSVVQTFTFDVIVYGAHGGTVTELQRIPVTIYVPPQVYPPSGQVTFDLNAPSCPAGQQWQWTSLQFDTDTPPAVRANLCSDPGTSIRFTAQSAWTSAGIASATPIVLGTTPCSPSPYNVSASLIAGGVSDRLPYLRLTATLFSYNGMTPTLRGYNQLGACVDAL